MVKHAARLTQEELGRIREWQSGRAPMAPIEMWKQDKKERRSQGMKHLCLEAFRDAVRGRNYNRAQEMRSPDDDRSSRYSDCWFLPYKSQ